MADAATGSAGVIRMDVWETGLNAAANTSDVNFAFYLIEARENNSTWSGGGIPASVDWVGVQTVWQGSFGFDWRPGGQQTLLIVNGAITVNHNPDGSGAVTFRGNIGNTGTSGAGGPASVDQSLTLTVLALAPNAPVAVTATRVSDTQINLSWQQASPSNGQAVTNDIITSVNNGPWNLGSYTTINAANATTLSAAPNQKLKYQVRGYRPGAGAGPWSADSNIVYTTPGAPTNATATKGSDGSITVNFTNNVAYSEHNHEVWHGTVSGGVTTWDSSPLATLGSGVNTYKHTAPNSSQVHIYRVRAKAGTLYSGYSTTGSVQLLVAPNKPSTPALNPYADKAVALALGWTHNPVDTTAQTAYEFSTSTDGGTTWSTTGKVTSAAQSRTIAAGTYNANTALTYRVRTWGQATTGGSDGTGASPWSDPKTITYKTAPTASITAPVNGSTLNDATVRVSVGFAQPEGATFVQAQLQLLQGATVLETMTTTNQVGVIMNTPVQNGGSYSVKARVLDSNGLWSAWVTNTFTVAYLPPVPATIITEYIEESGFGQITLVLPDAGSGQTTASTVTITRTIGDETETIVSNYPAASDLGFLDTTPTIHGTNTYTVTTTSILGAQTTTTADLVTNECRRAFLSKGDTFDNYIVFGGNLQVDESLSVASSSIQAAGRVKPIGLYGVETSVQLKVGSRIFENFGSTIEEVVDLLLVPGKACYRDPSGRRVFGTVKGSVKADKVTRGDLSFTMIETS